MHRQLQAWLIVLVVFLVGIVGLLPMQTTEAATSKLSGELQVGLSYLSHNERWFVFKALHPNSNTDYDLYVIDLTIQPYTFVLLEVPPLQANDDIQFSASDRYLLINRSTSTFTWELYVHDFEADATYFVTYGQDRIGAQITPNEQRLLLQPGYGHVLYSLPVTGGEAIALTPPDFPNPNDYFFSYQPTPDGTHVIMTAMGVTNTLDGYVGYAPLTATGTTLWHEPGQQPTSVLFNSDGTEVYIATSNYINSDKLLRFTLPKATSILVLEEGNDIFLRRGDSRYAFVERRESSGERMLIRLTLDSGELVPFFATTDYIERTVVHEPTNRLVIGTWVDDQNKVYGVDYETLTAPGHLITVAEAGIFFNHYAFTPDGSAVVVGESLDIETERLHRVTPDGSVPPLLLVSGISVDRHSFQPSSDSRAVWAILHDGGQSRLQYIPLNDDPPYTVFAPEPFDILTLRHLLENDQVIVRVETSAGERSFYITDMRPAATLQTPRIHLDEGMSTPLYVTLMPSTTIPVTVTFAVTGTVNNQDITIMPQSVVIPAFTAIVTATLNTIADGQAEAPETMTISILTSGGAVSQSPMSVTLTLVDQFKRIYLPPIRYFD